MNSYAMNQWVTIDGQNIYLDRLEVYPTQARIFFAFDERNSAIIKDLDIYFKDNNGNIIIKKLDGVMATRSGASNNTGTMYYDSTYFSGTDQLTMYISGITMNYKDKSTDLEYYADKTITLEEPIRITIN